MSFMLNAKSPWPFGSTVALILAAMAWCDQASAQAQPNATEQVCRLCHRDQFAALEGNPHRVLDSPEWRERTGNAPACINCHGDVSDHIAAGGGRGSVFAFREEPPLAQTEVCQGCHGASHPEFDMSAHAQAGLSCSSCHSQHGSGTPPQALLRPAPEIAGRFDRLGPSSRLCVDCHDDMLAAFDFNERHRLREGALECTSCHDPHASATRSLLGGLKQSLCLDCHRDKGGPFVFEHAASRIEGCTACHTPHGSPNRHLLAHQRTGELCLTCHASVPQFHLGFNPAAPPRFGLDTQCTNCHSTIHGSNLDPHFLK